MKSAARPADLVIRPAHSYLAKAGGWIFDVERAEEGWVYYTVEQTGQKCQARLIEFRGRVSREVGS